MLYRIWVYVFTGGALLAGLILAYLYFIRDRGPSRWSRSAELATGMIAIVVLAFTAQTLGLVAAHLADVPPEFRASIPGMLRELVRLAVLVWLWRLVWIYLHPLEVGESDTPKPGSMRAVK